MVEELLYWYVVITILSEHVNPHCISLAQMIQCKIIHALPNEDTVHCVVTMDIPLVQDDNLNR